MKLSKLLVLSIIPTVLCSCVAKNSSSAKPSSSEEGEEVYECYANAHMMSMVNSKKEKTGYTATFHYKDNFFDGSATTYSNDIKLISFASSLVPEKKDYADAFFTKLQFETVAYGGYEEITEDTIGYYIAHKSLKNYDLLAVSIRGFEYEKEWANNCILGVEGNHKGFDDRANELLTTLKPIMATYTSKPLKLWVSGYSRAGAVANLLAHKMLSSNDLSVNKESLFVYTYEAPGCISAENAVAYENVFNHLNDIDLVATLPPAEYGLTRCGVNVIINKDKNIDQALLAFDNEAILPAFTPSTEAPVFANEKEFINYFYAGLLKDYITDPETLPEITISTRADYVKNLQPHLSYAIGLFMSLPNTTVNKIKNKISTLSGFEYLTLLAEDGLYDLIKPMLDEDNIQYDDAALKAHLNGLVKIVASKFNFLVDFIDTNTYGIKESMKNNILRVGYMHSPEVVYSLIK